jgi:hypothetical protein
MKNIIYYFHSNSKATAGGTAGLVRIAPAKQLFIRLHVALRTNPYHRPF